MEIQLTSLNQDLKKSENEIHTSGTNTYRHIILQNFTMFITEK